MRLALPFLFLGLCMSMHADTAQEAAKPTDPSAEKIVQARPQLGALPPSLGISIQKPDPMVAAQLPELPKGMGFLVTEVEEGGPAAQAGIQVHDVIWKLGDQMLVNNSQFAALLSLRQPGQKVEISGYRSGKSQQFKVKLGKPKSRVSSVLAEKGSNSRRGDSGITQVVNSSEMFAKTVGKDGVAEILKVSDGYELKIKNSEEKPIFNASIPAGGSFEEVPSAWRFRVMALKRALDQSISGELPVVRPPRPRVVPPPTTPKESVAP